MGEETVILMKHESVDRLLKLIPILEKTAITLSEENAMLRASKKLLSVKSIAKMLDFTEQTTAKYLKTQKVVPYIFSDRRSTRYDERDILKLIESKKYLQHGR